jgi:hypothetical protein
LTFISLSFLLLILTARGEHGQTVIQMIAASGNVQRATEFLLSTNDKEKLKQVPDLINERAYAG